MPFAGRFTDGWKKTDTHMKTSYEKNKAAKVGEMITCPVCGEQFKKKQYAQAFCSRKCKDDYWNNLGDRHTKHNEK